MKLRTLISAAALSLLAGAAFAAPTSAPAGGTGAGPMKHEGMCKENAQECTQLAGKFDQWCSANADKCTDLKAHVEKHREWCEANKDKCDKMMEHHMRGRGKGDEPQDNGDDQGDGPGA